MSAPLETIINATGAPFRLYEEKGDTVILAANCFPGANLSVKKTYGHEHNIEIAGTVVAAKYGFAKSEIIGLDAIRESIGRSPFIEHASFLIVNQEVASALLINNEIGDWLGAIIVPIMDDKEFVVYHPSGRIEGTRKLMMVKDRTNVDRSLMSKITKEYAAVLAQREADNTYNNNNNNK